jgi:hypothetical protein
VRNNLPSETTTINGTEYEVTMLPYSLGRKLLVRLYKVLAPPLASVVAEAPNVNGDVELNLESLATLIGLAPALSAGANTLAEHLTEDDLEYVVSTLMQFTKIKNERGIFVPLTKADAEFHYAGNYGEQFQWLWFALKVNYAGFLKGQSLADLSAKAEAARKAKSSQNTSTGISTESPVVIGIPPA